METTTKVLIVDDEPSNLEILNNIIATTSGDFDVFQVVDPKKVMDICLKEFPDIVITDWEMPGMSGVELIKELKANDATKDIPVMMCTGIMTTSEHLRTALEAGAIDYIRKPIDEIELVARLHSVLEIYHSQIQIQEQLELLTLQKERLADEKERRESFLVHELTLKDRDISDLAMMLAHKQEMAERVLGRIKEIRASARNEGLNDLVVELQMQVQSHDKQTFIQENIDTVNAAFFAKLAEQFPQLTEGEKELCGMIKVGLSSKEIAELKTIDPKSVRKNRQRLRKKIGMTPEQDIYAFFKTF